MFAVSTITAYVALCVYSTAGLQRVKLGPLERYGEVISGAFIPCVGVVFWLWPVIRFALEQNHLATTGLGLKTEGMDGRPLSTHLGGSRSMRLQQKVGFINGLLQRANVSARDVFAAAQRAVTA
jgi:hypothetical protein